MDRHRKHDVILISDSNVRVRPSYLRETACYLAEPGVGLVTNLFAGVGEAHAGAVMENLQLNGFIAGGMAGVGLRRDLRGGQVDDDARCGSRRSAGSPPFATCWPKTR